MFLWLATRALRDTAGKLDAKMQIPPHLKRFTKSRSLHTRYRFPPRGIAAVPPGASRRAPGLTSITTGFIVLDFTGSKIVPLACFTSSYRQFGGVSFPEVVNSAIPTPAGRPPPPGLYCRQKFRLENFWPFAQIMRISSEPTWRVLSGGVLNREHARIWRGEGWWRSMNFQVV